MESPVHHDERVNALSLMLDFVVAAQKITFIAEETGRSRSVDKQCLETKIGTEVVIKARMGSFVIQAD